MLDQQDIQSITTIVQTEVSKLRGDMSKMETGLRGEISQVEHGLSGQISGVRGDMKTMEAGIRGDMSKMETGLRGEITGVKQDMVKMKDEIISGIGELLEQTVLPRIEQLETKFQRVEQLEGTVTNLPTKEYMDNKIANATSDIMRRVDGRPSATLIA